MRHARFMTVGLVLSLGAIILATAVAAQQVPQPLPFPIPSLSEPGVRRNFESRVRELCRTAFTIEEIAAANGTPRDTFVCQTPPPKTLFGCRARVRVYISNGMPRQPPYDEKTGVRTPEPCSEPVDNGLMAPPPPGPDITTSPAAPVPPTGPAGQPQKPATTTDGAAPGGDKQGSDQPQSAPTWPMADLSQPNGMADLDADTQRYCHRAAAPEESYVEAPTTRMGALIRQVPDPGVTIDCSTRIQVFYSNGDICATASRLTLRRLFVGDRCGGPTLPVWTIVLVLVGLAGIGLVIARVLKLRNGEQEPPSPPPRVVAGTARPTSRPDPGGLHRAAPDIVLETAGATVMAIARPPLDIQKVEISDG